VKKIVASGSHLSIDDRDLQNNRLNAFRRNGVRVLNASRRCLDRNGIARVPDAIERASTYTSIYTNKRRPFLFYFLFFRDRSACIKRNPRTIENTYIYMYICIRLCAPRSSCRTRANNGSAMNASKNYNKYVVCPLRARRSRRPNRSRRTYAPCYHRKKKQIVDRFNFLTWYVILLCFYGIINYLLKRL